MAGNTEETLNLSVNFYGGVYGYSEYINLRGEKYYEYPISIDIVNKNITVISRALGTKGEYREYINKLTDKQYFEIREMVSALKKYDISKIARSEGGWNCELKIDNQIYYKNQFCGSFPFSSHPERALIPEDIGLLFKYIAGLFPFSLLPNSLLLFELELKDKKTSPQPSCAENTTR